MEKLNHECIAEIFQYLPILDRIRYERVNKLWKEASESSWKSFRSLDIGYLKKSTNIFEQKREKYNENLIFYKILKRTGKYLQYVDVISAFGYFEEKSKNRNSLDLSSVIQYLSIYCENILELSITCYRLKQPDAVLSQLFLKNKGLKSLEIYYANLNGNCFLSISSDSLEKLVLLEVHISPILPGLPIHFKNLKSFQVINDCSTSRYDEYCMTNILNFLIESLIKSGPNITEFVIKQSSEYGDIEDRTIQILLSSMKNLNKVVLGNLYINNDILMSLPKDSLETMLIDTFDIHSHELDKSLPTFRNLKFIGFQKLTFCDDLANVLSLCESIKSLDLSQIFEFEVSSSNLKKMFKGLINLEILNLPDLNDKLQVYGDTDDESSDEFFKILGSNCKSLKAINLKGCTDCVTENSLNYITSIKSLEILAIAGLANVTDKSLNLMPNIAELYCKNNCNFENEGLINLLKTSPNLKILDISGCRKIDNKLIGAAIETVNLRKQNLHIFFANSGIDPDAFANVPSSVILRNEFVDIPDIFNVE